MIQAAQQVAQSGTSWSDIFAGAALALSIVALALQYTRFTANVLVIMDGEAGSTGFIFQNVGRATARNVNLSFDHFEPNRPKPRFATTGPTYALPLGHVPSGGRVRVSTLLIEGIGPSFDVEVSWDDCRPWRVKRMQTVGLNHF